MTDTLPRATLVLRKGEWSEAADALSLDYAGRFLRRRRVTTDAGREILVDLAETVSLDDGDALRLGDGTVVAVRPAPEELVAVTGPDMARLAWHIGNRHTPCQIGGGEGGAGRLMIRRDHVIEAMLTHLGAILTPMTAPFRPEGGAYGHGRTLGHDHGPATADGHDHDHGHDRHATDHNDDDHARVLGTAPGRAQGHFRVHTHGSHRPAGSHDDDPVGEA